MNKKQTKTARLLRTFLVAVLTGFVTAADLVITSSALGEVTIETRALSGTQAPGTEPGVTFESFGYPTINASGQVAFLGYVTNINPNFVIPDKGIWSETAGSIGNPGLIARDDDDASGTPAGVKLDGFVGPVLNDNGMIAFRAVITGPDVDHTNNFVIYSQAAGPKGSLELFLRDGDAAPDTPPGVQFTGISAPVLNNAGQITFTALLSSLSSNGFSDRGIWSEAAGSSGNPGILVRTGNAAPGTGSGIIFSHIDIAKPVLNDAGQTAFWAQLTGNGVDSSNDTGIWSKTTDNLDLIIRTGDHAPGTESGVKFRRLLDLAFNDVGETAFRGRLTGTGVDGSNNEGIWSEAAGSAGRPGIVVRTGDPAPGTEPGVTFRRGLARPSLNAKGHTAFRGELTGTGVNGSNDEGIWSEAVGSISNPGIIARTGDAAPGTKPGVVFSSLRWDPILNNAGQVAFRGELFGTGVDLSNNTGIWATDLDGLPTLVIRKGDLLDIDDNPLNEDLRIIASIDIDWEYGQPAFFNDAGQLAFHATFTDGTEGIFVANTLGDVANVMGDYNGNGIVDAADYTIWQDNFGSTTDLAADGNGNGIVDAADYTVWQDNFGNTNASANTLTTIPEPTTGLLVVTMAGFMLKPRRTQQ
ncbi:DUF7453 family protein [Algisphaera agarilytica]|uniref:PEP-CTERM protein-sorting domain-containing protein n=1 Tax=Algisphaera agarilytica TaxID=1385975 RepID=A0A7X0H5R0_9BACT|nr:choice-of-anchor tandem repeat NxxGxxAF-containing protein [Algisphaera agarilytica]MBB6429777.1 hypothetical protein [Algisphaera agarilytica]